MGWLRAVVLTFFALGVLGAACRHVGRDKSLTDRPRRPIESGGSGGKESRVDLPGRTAPAGKTGPAVHHPACFRGCPNSERNVAGRLLLRDGWVLFNNPKTKFADWAAYRVSPATIGRSRPRKWKADPELPPEETLEPEDFQGAHAALQMDRGHQVPLASFSGTRNYEPLNYMSNVTPQRSVLNQKLWNLLEQAERKFVLEHQAPLFVVTGPLYEREMETLPGADESHQVPSAYFKVMAHVRGDEIETAALIAPQSSGPSEGYCEHSVTIDEVERRAKLDVFPLLPEQQARVLESEKGALFRQLGCVL